METHTIFRKSFSIYQRLLLVFIILFCRSLSENEPCDWWLIPANDGTLRTRYTRCLWKHAYLKFDFTPWVKQYDFSHSLTRSFWIPKLRVESESCLMYEWVMSHTWMSHVAYMNKSFMRRDSSLALERTSHVAYMKYVCMLHIWNMYEWVTSHIWIRHVARHFTHAAVGWVLSHIWMSSVTHVDETCHTCVRCYCTHMNASRHTFEQRHAAHTNESCHTCEPQTAYQRRGA